MAAHALAHQLGLDTNSFLIPEDEGASVIDFEELFKGLSPPLEPSMSVEHSGTGRASRAASGSALSPPASKGSGVTEPIKAQQTGRQPTLNRKSSNGLTPADTSNTAAGGDIPPKRTRDVNKAGSGQRDKVKDLESIVQQKAAEYERLQHENSNLKFQHAVLEKVVRLRNTQLALMRDLADDIHKPSTLLARFAAGEQLPDKEGPMSQLACAGAKLTNEEKERFRRIGKLEFVEEWKNFIAEASVHLLSLEADPSDEATLAQLQHQCVKGTYLFKHTSMLAPDTILAVTQMHLETGQPSVASPSHWQAVVGTLGITPQQQQELAAVYGLYQRIMHAVLSERAVLNAHMATGLHPDLKALSQQMTISPECEVLAAMQKNVRKEKSAHLLLRGYFFGATLNELQFAKACCFSYPHIPDATAIVAAIVELAQAPTGP